MKRASRRPKKRDSEKFLICAPKLRVHTKMD